MMFLTSCSKNLCDCLESTGSLSTEERAINEFTSIRTEDNINLILCRDTVCHVSVECGAGLIKDIHTGVEGGRLRIRNTNRCNWVRDLDPVIKVYVFYKKLEELDYSSTGNISTRDTLKSERFTLNVRDGAGSINMVVNIDTAFFNEHEGTADISLFGKVKAQYIYNNGLGPVNALGLASFYSFVHNRGTNDCFVKVSDRLEANIEYYGNIYYLGDPPVIISWITGEGKLIPYAK